MSESGLAAERARIWRPLILDLASVADRDCLAALASSGDMFSRHDTIVEQLRYLIAIPRGDSTRRPSTRKYRRISPVCRRRITDAGSIILGPDGSSICC